MWEEKAGEILLKEVVLSWKANLLGVGLAQH